MKKLLIAGGVLYAIGMAIGGPAWPVTIPRMVGEKLDAEGRRLWGLDKTGDAA